MDARKIFDRIPEQFDRWRPRYCEAAFRDIIAAAKLDAAAAALEIGPGTGQATEPILRTGCDYLGVELGEHLARFTADKFSGYPNFHIVNGDFAAYDFGEKRFDLVYSAAAIQWIGEEIGFSRSFDLLKPGGTLAMMYCRGDYRTPNEALYRRIQAAYDAYFHTDLPYDKRFVYENAVNYGFIDLTRREYSGLRVFDAEGYVSYISTHSDHIALPEPHRARFFSAVRQAILDAGNRIEVRDSIVLYLARRA